MKVKFSKEADLTEFLRDHSFLILYLRKVARHCDTGKAFNKDFSR